MKWARGGQEVGKRAQRRRRFQPMIGTMMYLTAVLLGLVALYLVVVAGVGLLQHRLLYLPERASVEALLATGLQPWPSRDEVSGFVMQPSGAVRGTVIVFHGNAGHAGHRAHYGDALQRLGLRVILAEYPGYGSRDGALGETSLVADAEATIALAHRLHGAPVLVIGESLGAGVAARAAAAQRELIAGLMLITPWNRLEDVAAHHYPWLPVRWLLRDRYDSAAHLAAFERPVLVVVAEHDRVVPAERGLALHEGLGGPKRLALVAASGHSDWAVRVDAHWWREAIAFLVATPAAPS